MANRENEGPEAACLGKIRGLGGAVTSTELPHMPGSHIPRPLGFKNYINKSVARLRHFLIYVDLAPRLL